MRRRRPFKRPSPAMVVALAALVVSFTGGAVAATLITGKDIKNGTIGKKDLKRKAVRTKHVKNRSLLAKDFKAGQLPAGPQGPIGPQGPAGEDGATGETGPATGPAGGDLTGNYPDPQLLAGVVGTAETGARPAALVRMTSAQTIESFAGPVGSEALVWGGETFDVGGMFAPAQGDRLTAPVAGIYQVNATVEWDGPSTNRRLLQVVVNGAQVAAEVIEGFDPSGDRYQTASTLVAVNSGDFINLVVGQNTGGNLNVEANASQFSAAWIGPSS